MREAWQGDERLFLNHGDGRDASASGKRYFTRGGVKYALLELLRQEPMHGYQMMKQLEEQSGGTYKPSAGAIYPTLQMLRDQGLVSSFKEDGKKIFEITDEGKAFLQEEREGCLRIDEEKSGASEFRGEYASHNKLCGLDKCEDKQDGMRLEREHEGEDDGGRVRNRRLTPAGKELLHLMKAAERAAMTDETKAVRLRSVLNEFRSSLRELTGGM